MNYVQNDTSNITATSLPQRKATSHHRTHEAQAKSIQRMSKNRSEACSERSECFKLRPWRAKGNDRFTDPQPATPNFMQTCACRNDHLKIEAPKNANARQRDRNHHPSKQIQNEEAAEEHQTRTFPITTGPEVG